MSTTAILIDWQPPYLKTAADPGSLLLAPLGVSTIGQQLHRQLSAADVQRVLVVPNFEVDERYSAALLQCIPDAEIMTTSMIGDVVDTAEPSDLLLLVDPRHYPVAGFEFRALLKDASNCRLAKHLVQLRKTVEGTQECVVTDAQQRVRRIRRLYDGVTRLEAAGVSASLLPVSVARLVAQMELLSLESLRALLATSNMPARDITASSVTLDLMDPDALIALNERELFESIAPEAEVDFELRAPGVWSHASCEIADSARLYGPVVLHRGVRIGAGAVVIGPVVLDDDAEIGERATVSQTVLGRAARVPAGAEIVQQVWAPGAAAPPSTANAAEAPPHAGLWSAAGVTMGTQQAERAPSVDGWAGTVKRAIDFSAALVGLLVLLPLLAVVALLVRLTSPGPIFFSHQREGQGGRVFRCWKFRTMSDGAHLQQRALYAKSQVDGPQFKMDNDPRITWLGSILRKTNVDELPQLWNVLRGEMSLIGPRPSPFRENQICVPWRKARLSVRPGITGLWQICRHERSVGDFHQWIFFDMLYVREWSLGLDGRILLATLCTAGGRWSVPLSWLIPARRLESAQSMSALVPANGFPGAARPRNATPAPSEPALAGVS
jgi:lipopolysaccharide/colanic/teichoic acid biosynthesis glycosyltransferase